MNEQDRGIDAVNYTKNLLEDEYLDAVTLGDHEGASHWVDGLKFFREGPGEGESHKRFAEKTIRELIPIYASTFGVRGQENKRASTEEEARFRLSLLSSALDHVLGLQ